MMKAHNRALDFVVLALSQGRKGNIERSAQLLTAALEEPDCVTAIQILEASNKQALLSAAKVHAEAAKKPVVKAKPAVAAKKPAVATKVKADADGEMGDDISDGLDDEEMMGLMDGGNDTDDVEEEEVSAAEDEGDDEGESGDDEGDETFARLLAAMQKKK